MNGLYFALTIAVALLGLVVVPYVTARIHEESAPRRIVARGWRGWHWNEDWKVDWWHDPSM